MDDLDFPHMEIRIDLEEDTDMVQAQQAVIDALRTAAEEAGQPLTVDQWELLKMGAQNSTLIFCRLADEEIKKLQDI